MFDSTGFTYVLTFSKIIVQKYQDSTRRQQNFENDRRYQSFVGGIPTKNIKKKGPVGQDIEKYQIYISCFLVDMKFISKLLKVLLMDS